jgi:hypothetical protein
MSSVVRLSRNQLIEWIESKEAGGGDATEFRRALEALGPDQDSRTRRHGSRFNNEEELTTTERQNNRVGDLFTDGLSDGLLARLVDLDRNHSSKELKVMCVEAGLSPGRDKKEPAASKPLCYVESFGADQRAYCGAATCQDAYCPWR